MKNRGFTLAELLIGILIFSILSASICSVLFGGIKTWKILKGSNQNLHTARILWAQMEEEWRNMILETAAMEKRPTFSWEREPESGIETMAWVFARKRDEKWSLIKVRYQMDRGNKKFYREEEVLASEREEEKGGVTHRGLPQEIQEMEVSFAEIAPDSPKALVFPWPESWEKRETLPKGMKVSLTFENGEEYSKTFWLPLAMTQ